MGRTRLGHKPPTPADRWWAVVRLALGTAQVGGATCGAVLLLQTGLSAATLWAVAVTTSLTLASRLLFRRRDV